MVGRKRKITQGYVPPDWISYSDSDVSESDSKVRRTSINVQEEMYHCHQTERVKIISFL